MLTTYQWRVDASSPRASEIAEAAKLLQQGETVAFPTETVYGLGADARSDEAVARIFEAKGRPSDNPLIVHIADTAQLASLAAPYDGLTARLMERFWPGPLTIVLPVLPGAVSPRVTAGLDTVAVRMPAHPVALALIAAAGCPVAAPSANRSGRPSPTLAAHVADDLAGRIAGIVDGGAAGVGLESTVVEVEGDTVRILRPGGITAEELLTVAERVEYDDVAAPGASSAAAVQATIAPMETRTSNERKDKLHVQARSLVDPAVSAAPRSPGMKYTHYAPQGTMELVQGELPKVVAYVQAQGSAAGARGERTGVLAFAEHADKYAADDVIVMGSLADLATAAQGLYAALRSFDERGTQRIWAESCPESGIGHALMNRLVKAAGHRIVRV
ncbi:L-threonylcarbamoyladenylate synthase [Paenibacillus phyllosphaerae]|uniref:Threonylcarbamoyl-AMP synthase n=1 Tax=Paenibacillus phyllosphaerae TaxID=274593 RepID=A0A7W5FMX5_9BACL|nr:L-threonylcarbamoyladenylate synthase [Paenibacillus phyllosphaerae]MBB3110593.1 L-threonylcarbamoyladenylate synthase [Paenibacillus phyllosphaerae]